MKKEIALNPFQKIEILETHSNGFEFRVLQKGQVSDWQVMHSSMGQKITIPDINNLLREFNDVKDYLEFLKSKAKKNKDKQIKKVKE